MGTVEGSTQSYGTGSVSPAHGIRFLQSPSLFRGRFEPQ